MNPYRIPSPIAKDYQAPPPRPVLPPNEPSRIRIWPGAAGTFRARWIR